jgi:3-phytase
MPARRWGKLVFPLLVLAACNDPAADAPANPELAGGNAGLRDGVRVATFSASLNRNYAGQLISDLSTPNNTQAKNAAETIQRTRPDVILINEFDFDQAGTAARLFQDNYLGVSINNSQPITYPYRYVAPSNTGIPSGLDLNNSGTIGGPDDAFGFGFFPGQFGMAVYSMYPILTGQVRLPRVIKRT